MKQKDIATILVVAIVSGVFSIILSSNFISSPKNRSTKVEVVQKISTDFPEPNQKYFNENSVNPTKLIEIKDNNNQAPFSGSR